MNPKKHPRVVRHRIARICFAENLIECSCGAFMQALDDPADTESYPWARHRLAMGARSHRDNAVPQREVVLA